MIHPNATSKITFDYDVKTTFKTGLGTTRGSDSRTYTGVTPWVDCGIPNLCGLSPVDNGVSDFLSLFPETGNRRFIKEAAFYKGTLKVEKILFTNISDGCIHANDGMKMTFVNIYRGKNATAKYLTWTLIQACTDNRLFLNSIQESNGGLTKPAYTFSYNITALPPPGSLKQDYWGYANANSSTNDFIPTYHDACTGGNTYPAADRKPSSTLMKARILESVTYPTGGFTVIDYEPHDVPSYHDCQTMVGGLRVKALKNYAVSGTIAYQKTFNYKLSNGSTSSGVLLNGFTIAKTSTFHNFPTPSELCNPYGYDYFCTSVTVYANPINTTGRIGGSHVGYSRVEEVNSGKTVYTFTATANDNGKVTKVEQYDAAANLLEQTDYTYISTTGLGIYYSLIAEADNTQDNKLLLCKSGSSSWEWRLQCCGTGTGTSGCSFGNKTYTQKLKRTYTYLFKRTRLVQAEVTTYNSKPYTATQTSLIKKLIYTYGNSKVLKPTIVELKNQGDTVLRKEVYVFPNATNVPATMISRRMLNEPVEVTYYVNGNQVYGTKQSYPATGTVFIPNGMQEKFASGSYTKKDTITSYDVVNGNVKSGRRDQDIDHSYIYSSDGARLTAVAINATPSEIAYTSFDTSDAYQGGWTGIIAAQVKYTTSGGATGHGYYNPNVAATITSPTLTAGKYIVSYYSKAGTISLPNATVHRPIVGTDTNHAGGWTYSEHIITVSSTVAVNIAANAFIDELRIYPADAQMKTVSYDRKTYLPQCICDVDGKSHRFVYDALNRLTGSLDVNDHYNTMVEYYYSNPSTYNGIITRNVQKSGVTTGLNASALTGADVVRSLAYFDGLGRPDQTVVLDVSPTSFDLVTYLRFDTYGRQYRAFKPYTIGGSGTAINNSYRTAVTTEQSSFYTTAYGDPDGANAFTESILEVSPLSRDQGSKNPGIWNAKPTSAKYMFNVANEVRIPITANTWYGANRLFKTEVKDEDLKTVITFTDLLGRKVMEDRGGAKTYYLYDNYGNVTQVIQPEASSLLHTTPTNINTTAAILKHSFLNTYDGRYRLLTKKVPGEKATHGYFYDRLDRLVMSVDPNGFKLFTKYDILSRPVLTGKFTGTGTPLATQALYENRSTTGHFYTTNLSFPVSLTEIYTVMYYDDYDFDGNYTDNKTYSVPSADAASYPATAYIFARGMSTGSKAGVLNTTGAAPTIFTANYPFYDKYGREIHMRTEHPYGTDLSWTQLHFAGWVLKKRLQHAATLNSVAKSAIINERFTYDHAGRLLNTYHKISDTGAEVTIAQNTYNEEDDLKTKMLASSQTIDYVYNIRGWMTKINNVASPAGDLFSMQINYNTAVTGLQATGLFNGNISSIQWLRGGNQAGYGFTYDGLNRITAGSYREYISSSWVGNSGTDKYSVSNLTYDLNGNIKTLNRNGLVSTTYGAIDQLTYNYDATHGNQLSTITESSLITKGFKKVSTGSTGYTYDNNGNVNADGYRAITSTTYNNHLNLPLKFAFGATNYIEYTYDANGVKWKKKTFNGTTTTEKFYLGDIEYNCTNLEALYHSDGRAIPSGASYEYHYTIKDHLGNSRVMFKMVSGTATLIQENHYYPFGLEMEGAFTASTNKYRYNGKELHEDFALNLYDYGARWYDPSVGRWTAVDPLADWAPDLNPFRYGFNNPLSYTDPFGLFETGREARRYRKRSEDGEVRRGKIRKDKDGSYSIRFGESGSVSKNSEGEVEYLSTASYTGPSISQHEPNLFERAEKSGFLGRVTVGFADDFWLTFQSLNPLDTRTTHLAGNFTSGDEAIMGFVGTAATVIPLGRATSVAQSISPQGLTILQRLNATQFSRKFKGTVVARTHPRIRGRLNKLMNSGINTANSKVQTGNVIFNATKITGKAVNREE